MSSKRYFYIDETSQDTKGRLFVVAIIISEHDADDLRLTCQEIEALSRKGTRKWMRTSPDRRLAYIQLALQKPLLAGRLTFGYYTGRGAYADFTCNAIALAVSRTTKDGDNVVLIDGLPKEQWMDYGRRIRRWGARIERVRGTRRDENDALIHLADALCGFVRSAYEGEPELKALFELALRQEILVDLRG